MAEALRQVVANPGEITDPAERSPSVAAGGVAATTQIAEPCRDFTNDSLWTFYSYSVELGEGPRLEAGEPVWVAIRAVAPNFVPFWGWRSSSVPVPPSKQLSGANLIDVSTGTRVLTITVDPDIDE